MKRFKDLYPCLSAIHFESVTLFGTNQISDWLSSKPYNERIKLIEKAIPLGEKLDKIAKEHERKNKEKFEEDFAAEEEAAINRQIEGRKYLNVVLHNEKKFVPRKRADFKKCMDAFNVNQKISIRNQKVYITALSAYFNHVEGTFFLTPDDRGASIPSVKEHLKDHIGN